MAAHMMFCASRRNGVQGIPFGDFLVRLVGECQDQERKGTIRPVAMTIGDAIERYERESGGSEESEGSLHLKGGDD